MESAGTMVVRDIRNFSDRTTRMDAMGCHWVEPGDSEGVCAVLQGVIWALRGSYVYFTCIPS
jgi:hypothetical protein